MVTNQIQGTVETQNDPICCAIPCTAPAEFEIVHRCGDPYDVTYACEAHIGGLLGHGTGAHGDARSPEWTVVALEVEPGRA